MPARLILNQRAVVLTSCGHPDLSARLVVALDSFGLKEQLPSPFVQFSCALPPRGLQFLCFLLEENIQGGSSLCCRRSVVVRKTFRNKTFRNRSFDLLAKSLT